MSTDALSQIKELEAKIQQLRGSQLSELQEKLREARQTVACFEAEIAKITGKAPAAEMIIRRTRTSPEEIRGRVLKALATTPTGLSQKEIADATSLNYNTVGLFLKKNPKNFKTTGSQKNKRYFLK
jgi:phage shock protein A